MRPAVIAPVVALALSGCSLFGSSKPQPDPLPPPVGGATASRAWDVALGARAGVGFVPALAAGSVWAAAGDGTVVRVDATSGRLAWRVAIGRPLTAGVVTDGRTAVVATRDGELVALDADGATRWTARIGAEVVTPPAVAVGTVLVRASDNRVIAFDAGSGERRWTFQRQNPPLVLRQAGGMAVSADTAFVGMPGGRLVAVNLVNGVPRWDVALAIPRGTTEIERIADVVGVPVPVGREVCATAYQGRVGCVDAASGNTAWARDFSSAAGLDADARGLVAIDAGDRVQAFSRSGEPGWERSGFARRNLSAPRFVDGAVVTGDLQGNVLVLARDDGRLMTVAPTDGSAIVSAPVAAGGLAIVQTSAGGLFALRIQ